MEVAPGYELLDDHQTPVPSDHIPMSRRAVATMAPVFIMAPDVDARIIHTPVDIRVVAPTVSRILRIRSPNAAGGAPVL